MAGRPSSSVVLYSLPGSMDGLEASLRRSGVRLVRLSSLRPRPIPPARWLPGLSRYDPPDVVVVTSRSAVEAGVRPWRASSVSRNRSVEFWAVGPGTARALRGAGIPRVRRPSGIGARAVAAALARKGPRRILYLRSDRAGPELTRALRRQGHRVIERVVYHLQPASLPAQGRRAVSAADLLVVTSPSGLSTLRRELGSAAFGEVARGVPLVVLGERSRRAARDRGFLRASVAPSTTPQRFTRHLLRELRHGGT